MDNIKNTLTFISLINKFRKIERDILLSTENRLENDLEHSYQLTIVAWYIARTERFNLDMDKVIKYALIHDLVEVYAGDTPLYSAKEEYHKSKIYRENEAVLKLEQNFPEFTELHKLIKKYNKKSDRESNFVYVVDKLLPILSIYLDKGHAWRSHNITVQMIIDKNISLISSFPELEKYFNASIDLIKKKPEYFINK